MKRKAYKTNRKRFNLFILFLFILSVSFFLMPFCISSNGETNSMVYIIGFLFWAGVIGVVITVLIINASRKSDTDFNESHSDLKQLGAIHFFKNRPAMIADISMMISLAGFIITMALSGNSVLRFLFISLFVFTFGMHCMLNGLNYIFIIDSKKRRERTI